MSKQQRIQHNCKEVLKYIHYYHCTLIGCRSLSFFSSLLCFFFCCLSFQLRCLLITLKMQLLIYSLFSTAHASPALLTELGYSNTYTYAFRWPGQVTAHSAKAVNYASWFGQLYTQQAVHAALRGHKLSECTCLLTFSGILTRPHLLCTCRACTLYS